MTSQRPDHRSWLVRKSSPRCHKSSRFAWEAPTFRMWCTATVKGHGPFPQSHSLRSADTEWSCQGVCSFASEERSMAALPGLGNVCTHKTVINFVQRLWHGRGRSWFVGLQPSAELFSILIILSYLFPANSCMLWQPDLHSQSSDRVWTAIQQHVVNIQKLNVGLEVLFVKSNPPPI